MQDPRPLMLRRVIIDMLPYDATNEDILTLQDRLGLVPSSLDTLEMERKESDSRIQLLKPISHAIHELSGWSAEAIAEYFLLNVVEDDDDEDDDNEEGVPVEYLRKVLVNQNQNVIVTAVHGIVSHLIASGILVYNKDKIR